MDDKARQHILSALIIILLILCGFSSFYSFPVDYTRAVPIDWNWTIENNTVYINNSWVYLSASPHTISSSGWVEFELESKVLSGNIDSIWGFNSSEAKPSNPQIWCNYTHNMTGQRWVEQYLNTSFWVLAGVNLGIENYSLYDVDYGNENNTKLWNLSCTSYVELEGWYNYSIIIAWTNQTHVDANYTFYYYDEVWETYYYDSTFFDWKTFGGDITVVNHNWKEFNKWYIVNATIQADHRYKMRCWIEFPFGGLEGTSGKYVWALKEHSKTMLEAIDSGRLVYLDPWWDSNWEYYRTITIDHDYIDSTLTNFPILVAISDAIGDKCDGGDSIRFLNTDNSTEYDYEIEKWVDGSDRIVWVKIPSISSNSDTVFLMYYGNSGASDNQNPTGVWDSNFKGVYHMKDSAGNCIDSTINSNDGIYLGTLPSKVTGATGYGQDLTTGGGDYISLPVGCHQPVTHTWECWFKADVTNEGHFLFTDVYDGESLMQLEAPNGDHLKYRCWVYGYLKWNLIPATAYGTTWRYIASAVETNNAILRLDDSEVDSDNSAAPASFGFASMFIGRHGIDETFCNMVVDEVRISDIVRSNAWLKASFHSQKQTAGFLTFGNEHEGNQPTQLGEVPANQSIGIGIIPDLYVLCTDADNDNLNATWWSNSSGSWLQFASNWTSFANNTNITQTNSNFSAYSTMYWWSVHCTDGIHWTNETYHFTTREVTTNVATNVEETTATLSGSIAGTDGMTCGFWYNTSTTSSSDFGNNVTVSGTFDSGETFTKAVTGLTSGDYYYVRAWNYKSGIDFFNSTSETYFLTKPYAPSNVSAFISENNISITWDNATINVTNRTNHVRYKTTGYPTSITDGIFLYNDSSLNSSVVYWYNPSVTYYFSIWTYINESGSPSLFQFSGSSNNSNILGSTKPTDLTVTDYNDTRINLSWTKGDDDTTITRKMGSYPIHSNDGTSVYNGSLETYTDIGLTPNTHYFYRAWNWNGTDNSSGYTNISHWTAPQPPQNVTTETTVTGGVSMDITISWDNGTGANRSVVRRSYTSQPILPIDGTEIYNNTLNTTTDSDSTQSAFYTVFSYNTTTGLFSPGTIVTWYVIYINCYDEETNESLWFDVFISNQDGSQTYESVDNTNPHYLNTSALPTGDDVKIIVSAASNYSEKSEISYWSVNENYTITYIVLSQTADSKSTTNVTCINEGDDAHSYPPFTLDGDLITILPDNADKFTKIFVNYSHEEYGSRLYYRDIETLGFFILNAYLPPTENKQLYLLEVIDEASNTVQDAHIEVKRSVNSTYVIVSRLLTDANGQADIDLIADRDYIFIISKTGYITENASWTPGTKIFTHTFKIIWETTPFEPDTFGDIISFYGTLYENNTMRVTFYDLNNEMIDSHFTIYENYNGTLTYMGEYNGTTSNDITFWINVDNATRLHIIVLFMNHSTLGEVINYRIVVYPVHVDREEGGWLENLIISVVGEFTFGYIVSFLWYLPCALIIIGMASIRHPGIGILAAGLYSVWITWYIEVPGEAKVLAFASIAIVTGFITLFLVKGKEAIH